MLAAYHIPRAIPFGAKKLKSNMKELKEAIDKCEEIGKEFKYFTTYEWIFDNKKAMKMYFNNAGLTEHDLRLFNIDVTRINWKMYMMNFAYGIKRFILKEEAELPSVGYNDVITVSIAIINIFAADVEQTGRGLGAFLHTRQGFASEDC